MQTYSVKLKEKVEIADQTWAFIFEKPETFLFEAGQYVVMTLPELKFPDERRGIRSLSIASAPYEDTLMFAMRITSSGFKKTLMEMNAGENVTITQAFGHFTLPASDTVSPIVFLIGGIGITPARSILRQAAHMQSKQPFQLFYSNRAPKDTAFAQELQSIAGLENYRCIDTMTNYQDVCEWSEESGYICREMIEKYPMSQNEHPYYFLVGAPLFIKAMEDMLHEMGVSDEHMKKDPFTGI